MSQISENRNSPNRRDFLRASAGGGFALGGLLGLGVDLRAAQEEVRKLKIEGAREVPSVCPYCAVGCGQIVQEEKNREAVSSYLSGATGMFPFAGPSGERAGERGGGRDRNGSIRRGDGQSYGDGNQCQYRHCIEPTYK